VTGAWNSTAKVFVVSAVLCTVGLLCSGLLSAERLVIITAIGIEVSLIGAFALAFTYWVRLRYQLRAYLDRPRLTDEEFAASLGGEFDVSLEVVNQVRQMAARRFWLVGGNRFYPNDRLEEDLYLSDLAPFGSEDFWNDLWEYVGKTEEDLRGLEVQIVTFGDVVVLADRLRRVEPVG
jgi:hypothetical protein